MWHVLDMTANKDKSTERLDLGLGAILAATKDLSPADLTVDFTPSTSNQGWTLGASEPPQKGQFDLLADERKWSEIVGLTEPRLSDSADVFARFWWIRGHLGAFSMPVTFLAAPLESLCRSLVGQTLDAPTEAILKETGLLTLSRLAELGDRAQIESMRRALGGIGVYEPKEPRERKRTGTSSFRALALDDDSKDVGNNSTTAGEVRSGVPLKRIVLTGLVTVFVIALLATDYLLPGFFSAPVDIASESFVRDSSTVEQAVSPIHPRDPSGKLDALFYSIGEAALSGLGQAADSSVAREQQSATAVRVAPVETAAPRQVLAPPPVSAPHIREQVNVAGPLEGAEFREHYERNRPSRLEREELQGGPPQAVLPQGDDRAFNNQRTYRVLAKTSVLSAPSYGGRVIGTLYSEDRVLVDGKLGRWLRLRSKKGRGGYVLAGDVEEVLDDASPSERER